MMKLHPDQIWWTAEKEKRDNSDYVYLIKQYAPLTNDRSKPYSIWTVDPQKGFLVTNAIYFSREGNIWITRMVETKEFSGGIWFPILYEEKRYDKADDALASKEPTSVRTIQLKNISINKEIADEAFTLEAIFPEEYRETTDVFRTGLDGKTEAFIYKYGHYIPRNQRYNVMQFAESLKGKPLPLFENMQVNYDKDQLKNHPVLFVFSTWSSGRRGIVLLSLIKKYKSLVQRILKLSQFKLRTSKEHSLMIGIKKTIFRFLLEQFRLTRKKLFLNGVSKHNHG